MFDLTVTNVFYIVYNCSIYCCITAQEYYDILWREIHLIGRAGFGADLEISDDSSISRCHANLTLVKKVPTDCFIAIGIWYSK